jgi:hypothetical protein
MTAAQGIFTNLLFIAFASTCAAQAPSSQKLTPLDDALELYQDYCGKTVIRSASLPTLAEFNKPIPSSDTNGMRIVLENELLNKGIEFVPLGEAIVMAVESGWKNSATANYIATIKRQLPSSPSVPVPNGEKPAEESIPPGTIDFRGADLNQFLDLYAMLLNRNILRPTQLASPTFKLRTQTPFSKSAVIYLLEVLLALNGIASVDDGTNFVQVAPLKQIPTLSLRAPVRDSSEPLLKPEEVPNIGYFAHVLNPAPGVPAMAKQVSPKNSANDVIAYYAELTGRIATPSKDWGQMRVVFRPQTRLTKAEFLYALETVLKLNGMSIVELDDKTISLRH